MGIDVGKARIGIALSEGSLALAHETLSTNQESVDKVSQLVSAKNVSKVYVGLPLSLSGQRTPSTEMAIGFARELAEKASAEVFMIDERLTTVSSLRLLREAGKDAKSAKSIIDSESARLLLDFALSSPGVAKPIGELDA